MFKLFGDFMPEVDRFDGTTGREEVEKGFLLEAMTMRRTKKRWQGTRYLVRMAMTVVKKGVVASTVR